MKNKKRRKEDKETKIGGEMYWKKKLRLLEEGSVEGCAPT